MLNRELEVTLNLAFKEARSKRHEFMTVEHLLLALLDNEAAATVLRACGANLEKLKHDLQEFIDFAASASRAPIGFYQAYPGLTVQDINSLFADSMAQTV